MNVDISDFIDLAFLLMSLFQEWDPIIDGNLVDKNLYENHKHTLSSYQEHIWSDKNVVIRFIDFVHFDVSKLLSEDLKIIGCVIQSVDNKALPAPEATVQLLAVPEAIDWVQVQNIDG